MSSSPKTLPWATYELQWLHIHITAKYCLPFQPLWWGMAHPLYSCCCRWMTVHELVGKAWPTYLPISPWAICFSILVIILHKLSRESLLARTETPSCLLLFTFTLLIAFLDIVHMLSILMKYVIIFLLEIFALWEIFPCIFHFCQCCCAMNLILFSHQMLFSVLVAMHVSNQPLLATVFYDAHVPAPFHTRHTTFLMTLPPQASVPLWIHCTGGKRMLNPANPQAFKTFVSTIDGILI